MEREPFIPPEAEVPFYDNEDYDAPEASEEDAQKLLAILDELKALLPEAEYFEQIQRLKNVEVADMEDLTLVSFVDPKVESAVVFYKESDPERISRDRLASVSFSPNEQERRRIFFDIYPDTVKRREWEEPDRSDIEPTDDVEEWKEQMTPRAVEWEEQRKEAEAWRKATGMDFVSQKTVERLLQVISEYREAIAASL